MKVSAQGWRSGRYWFQGSHGKIFWNSALSMPGGNTVVYLDKRQSMCDLNAYILFCVNHTMIKLILEEYIDHKIRRSNREIGLCSQKEWTIVRHYLETE